MEFNEYSPATLKTSTTIMGVPAMRVMANGVIMFNKLAVELIGKDVEKDIIVLQDKKNPKDFYLHFTENGFKLRPYKKNDGTIYFQQKKLSDLMRDVLKPPKKAFGLKVLEKTAEDGMIIYPLLTSKFI